MRCDHCGAQHTGTELFCPNCGTRLAVPQTVPAQEEIPAPELVWQPPVQPQPPLPQEAPVFHRPAAQFPCHRGLAKMFFLGLLTLGIYPTVIWCRMVTELNIAASRYDGQRTMPYFAMTVLAPMTLGIVPLVWIHRFCRRIGNELSRRGLNYRFGAADFWLWNVLGSLIVVGPFIYLHKLCKSMNLINEDFNARG